jgi:hypothetical protein
MSSNIIVDIRYFIFFKDVLIEYKLLEYMQIKAFFWMSKFLIFLM